MRDARIHGIHRVGWAVGVVSAIVLGLPCLTAAQEAAAPAGAREIPRPDQLEPGVSTSTAAPAAAAPTAAPAAPAASSATVTPAALEPPAAPAAPPAASAKAGGTPQSAATAKAAPRKGGADRLELDATDITGNRELPKVLYIVPWKRSDLGDVVGRPANSLLDEVLQPLDRDVFQRENRYYDALKPGAGDAKAGAAQSSQTKP
jgi:hypothetical protein